MSVRKELLYNDGEGLDFNDLNNAQRYMRSALYDGVLGYLARQHELDNNYGPTLNGPQSLRILGNSLAPSITGSSLVVTVGKGTCGQHNAGGMSTSGATVGDDVNFIWHDFDTSVETATFTSGAASGSNPRWDILQAKIDHTTGAAETRDFEDATTHALSSVSFDKERQTRLTMSIKAGTAAGSPTEPDPDSGYVKLFAWRIETSATAITAANFRDYRMPVGLRIIDITGRLMARTGGFTESSDGVLVADGASTRTAIAMPQCGGAPWRTGRVVAVGLASDTVAGSGASAILANADYGVNPYTSATLLDVSASLIDNTAGFAYRAVSLMDQAVWMDGTHAPSIVGSTDLQVFGTPTILTSLHKLELRLASGATHADTFSWARFYVAGG
jgi:hypothetical protein